MSNLLSDRYQPRQLLRATPFYSIYMAYDYRLEREVAITIFTSELSANPRFTDNFIRHICAASRLNSPYIVRVFDTGDGEETQRKQGNSDDSLFGIGSDNGEDVDYWSDPRLGLANYRSGLFIVSELVGEKDLSMGFEQITPHPRQVFNIIIAISRALEATEALNLPHGNINPYNVVYRSGKTAKLINFGVTLALRNTGVTLEEGKDFWAPEVVEEPSARSDIYSLAAVFYWLLTGRTYIVGENPDVTRYRSDIPEGVNTVLRTALAINPGDRFASAKDMRMALLAATGEVGEGHTASLREQIVSSIVLPKTADALSALSQTPASKPRRGRFIAFAAAGVAVFSLAVGVGLFLLQPKPAPPETIIPATVLTSAGADTLVPDVLNLSKKEAMEKLRQAGFQIELTVAHSATIPADHVITMVPLPNSKAVANSRVSLVLSNGMLEMPDFVGMSYELAKQRAEGSELQLKASVEEDRSCRQDGNQVNSQFPAAGAIVSQHSKVLFKHCAQAVPIPQRTDQASQEPTNPGSDSGDSGSDGAGAESGDSDGGAGGNTEGNTEGNTGGESNPGNSGGTPPVPSLPEAPAEQTTTE